MYSSLEDTCLYSDYPLVNILLIIKKHWKNQSQFFEIVVSMKLKQKRLMVEFEFP